MSAPTGSSLGAAIGSLLRASLASLAASGVLVMGFEGLLSRIWLPATTVGSAILPVSVISVGLVPSNSSGSL